MYNIILRAGLPLRSKKIVSFKGGVLIELPSAYLGNLAMVYSSNVILPLGSSLVCMLNCGDRRYSLSGGMKSILLRNFSPNADLKSAGGSDVLLVLHDDGYCIVSPDSESEI